MHKGHVLAGRRKRVVVVDDSRTMQAVLEQICSSRLGLDVVGLAGDARSAVELIRSLKPDLVTVDLCMPYIDGLHLLKMIEDMPEIRKVVISGHAFDNLAMVSSLEAAGADACIDKKELSRDPARVCSLILAVLARPKAHLTPRSRCLVDPAAAIAAMGGRSAGFPIPVDERERLSELRRYWLANDNPDPQLDLLTAHLKATTDFPTVLITFIDSQYQWVKSAHGFARGSMPRAHAFCNYTLCAGETFIVSNAAGDVRFAANPLVTDGPRIRTYVGHPIESTEGVRLGAICLIDTKQRVVTPDIIVNLRSICQIAAEIIKLRAPPMSKAA